MKYLTTTTLQRWARNAAKTYLSAHGHNKAEMNKLNFESYKTELESRGLKVDIYQYAEKGLFNGEGSY